MGENGKPMTDIWKKVTSEKAEELIGIDELDPDLVTRRQGERPMHLGR